MKLNKFGTPIFNETDVFNRLYQGNTSVLPSITIENNSELEKLANIANIQFNFINDEHQSIEEWDNYRQQEWFIPSEYKKLDIQELCIAKCDTMIEQTRVFEEYSEFARLNMIDLLRWCKYFVDTCTNNNILWGVGRGSSVASYILYLIGVHRIDSIKYNLDWKEFLR